MEARLDDEAEEAPGLSQLDQPVPRDAVAGLRQRLVEAPRRAAQVVEAAKAAVAADDDVGEIDGPAAVAPAAEDRRRHRRHRQPARPAQLDVGQAADEAHVGVGQFVVALARPRVPWRRRGGRRRSG